MEFSRQESWSGLPFPPPRGLPTQGLNRSLLHLLYWQMHSLPLSHQGSPVMQHTILFIIADFFSWLQILQTEILMFSFLSWILSCSVDSEPFARLAQALVSWTALNHLLDLLLHVNHICDYCLLALQPSPTRGSQQSGIFLFLSSSVNCSEVFLFVYLFYLGGCGWGTEDVFFIPSTILGTLSYNLSKNLFLALSCGFLDLSSPTRVRTRVPAMKVLSPSLIGPPGSFL